MKSPVIAGIAAEVFMLYMYSRRRSSGMLAIRLPEEIEKRLTDLAKRTGRSKSFYVREALLEHLDDLEDYYLAAARVEEARLSLDEVEKRLGLDD